MVQRPDDRLKQAFLKIKGDIAYIYAQLLVDRQLILDFRSDLSTMFSKLEKLEKKLNSLLENDFSTGNKGVNDALTTRQRPVNGQLTDRQTAQEPINLAKKTPETHNLPQKGPHFKLGFMPKFPTYYRSVNDPLTVDESFAHLSKNQLQFYITLFRLENELQRPVTLIDLCNKINRTDSAVRHYLRILKTLKIPLYIYRNADNMLCITVPRELRSSEFEKKLMDLLDSVHHRPKRE